MAHLVTLGHPSLGRRLDERLHRSSEQLGPRLVYVYHVYRGWKDESPVNTKGEFFQKSPFNNIRSLKIQSKTYDFSMVSFWVFELWKRWSSILNSWALPASLQEQILSEIAMLREEATRFGGETRNSPDITVISPQGTCSVVAFFFNGREAR